MKKIILFGVLLSLIVVSCSKEKMARRHYVIPRDTFVNVLVDFHLMDAITNAPQMFRKFDPRDSLNTYEEIFRKYDVTRAQFDSTLVYYTREPEKYAKIYDDVILKLNLRLDKLKNNEPSFNNKENKDKDGKKP